MPDTPAHGTGALRSPTAHITAGSGLEGFDAAWRERALSCRSRPEEVPPPHQEPPRDARSRTRAGAGRPRNHRPTARPSCAALGSALWPPRQASARFSLGPRPRRSPHPLPQSCAPQRSALGKVWPPSCGRAALWPGLWGRPPPASAGSHQPGGAPPQP